MRLVDLGDVKMETKNGSLTPRVFDSVYMIVASRP